jgi:glutathione S-transferase
MRLYNAGLSPNALRVRAVANELGIELDLVEVDLRDAKAKVETLLPRNPNAKVPVLVDGDFVLWESRAIIAWLASLKPEAGLYPADPKRRAIVDQWSYWGAIHLGPALQRVAFERFMKPRFGMGTPDEAAIVAPLGEIAQFLPVLDGGLAGKEWLAGELSLADFSIAPILIYREVAGIDLTANPNVARWIERLEARPSWQRAVAPVRHFIAGELRAG